MPASERSRWCRFLAASTTIGLDEDLAVMQRAVWMLDGDAGVDPDLLTRAAELANKRFDGALAERLAARAARAGAGFRALLARGEACFQLGRYEDALAHLTTVDETQLADDDLARLAMLLAEAGFWGLGRAGRDRRRAAPDRGQRYDLGRAGARGRVAIGRDVRGARPAGRGRPRALDRVRPRSR